MNARELAVYTLIDIQQLKLYNNLSLKKLFNDNPELSSQDKAFITELVNGTLRNIILIDFIIDSFSKTKTTSSKMKPIILNILRISVYQIYFMPKIPHSAVCNEAVNLVKKKKFNGLSGYVNGVLRNIARNIDSIELPDENIDIIKHLAIKYSYSEWVIEKLIKQFENNNNKINIIDEVKAICKANTQSPKVCICVNINKITPERLKEALIKEGMTVTDGTISKNALYIGKTKNIAESKCFKKGLFHIMDESSMMAVEVLNPVAGDTIIDVCSAPGGKAFYTSYLCKDNANIISRDIHEHKIGLIEKGVSRLGIKSIKVELKDASKLYQEDTELADKIIIDAPCSGFGIVKKKPDIKYNKSPEDLIELVKIQRNILETSANYLKKDGILVYSTCTIFDDENINNITWFCENYNFKLEEINNLEINNININDTCNKGYINIYPHLFNTDGFFIAKLRKI